MVCLVTGSSRGLGRSIALKLGSMGNSVIVNYIDQKDSALEVASGINDSLVIRADVSNFSDVRTMVKEVMDKYGQIDLLVNNAGITNDALAIRTTEDDFDNMLSINLKGAFNCIKSVARQMIKQRAGQIINISSYAGVKGKAGLAAYSSSKAGLIGLTKSAAIELSRYEITVNVVLPGFMMTDMGLESSQKGKETALRENLLKDYSDPDRIADFIYYLSGTKGITGQVYNLDSRII